MNLAILEQKNLNSSEKVLWLRLYTLHKKQKFQGTYETIAKELEMNKETVKLNMSKLKRKGYITYKEIRHIGIIHMEYRLVDRAKEGKK